MPQVRVKAANLIMVKVATDNLEGSYNETEAIIINPIFREIKQIAMEAKAMAVDLSNSENTAVEGLTIRIAMECISISITHMTHNQNNMALPAVYVVNLIIPLSIATRENMT